MRKYLLLLKMLLYGAFGINKAIHSKDKKQRRQILTFSAAWAVLILCAVLFSYYTAVGCAYMGITDSLPALTLMFSSVVTMFLMFFELNGMVFGLKDYDAVMSLPVTGTAVILSRVSLAYFMNAALAAVMMTPSALVFGNAVNAPAPVCAMLLAAPLIAPLIPMTAALTASAAITAVSARFKHKNIIAITLGLAAAITVFMLSFNINGDAEMLADLGKAVGDAVNKIYPPARLFSTAVNGNDAAFFAGFAAASAIPAVLFTAVLNKFYIKINTAIFSHYRRNDYRVGSLKQSAPLKALYLKEIRRFITCAIYAVNQGFGAALIVVSGIALALADLSWATGYFEYMHCVPFVMALIVSLTSTTCVSLSLEGKYRWIVCSVPVSAKTVFDSKIAVHLTVYLPACLAGGALWARALKPGAAMSICMIAVPAVYTTFAAVAGMYINVRYPKYDWASEYYCVKGGSASLMIALAVSLISTFVPLALCFLLPGSGPVLPLAASAATVAAAYVLYRRLRGVKLYF